VALRRRADELAALMQHGRAATPVRAISDHLLHQFSTLQLTLLSIIQGVALIYLVDHLVRLATPVTATVWLQTAATVIVIVLSWHLWMMSTLAYVWLPGVIDIMLLFLLGVTEVVLAATIGSDATDWFGAVALHYGVALAASGYVRWRATSERRNSPVWTVRRHAWSYYGWTAGIVGLATSFWLLARAGHVSPTRAVWPALVMATQVVFVAISQLQVRIALHRALVAEAAPREQPSL
jgi:hypothetical protein